MLTNYNSLVRSTVSPACIQLSRRLYSVQKGRPNEDILRLLQRCKDEEESKPDANSFRIVAYVKAMQAVSRVTQPIQAGKEVLELRGIGPGIMNRIDDYLYASRNESKSTIKLDEVVKSRSIAELAKLPKIGMGTAKKLVEAGCVTVAQINDPTFSALLSPKQRIAVRFVGHLNQPVSRSEAACVLAFCQSSLETNHELHLVGEYRRNVTEIPDIQLMIMHPDFVHIPLPSDPSPFHVSETPSPIKSPPKKRTRKSLFSDEKTRNYLHDDIIPLLQQRGLLVDTLSKSDSKWEGIVRLPGPEESWGTRLQRISGIENLEGQFRRMTIHLVPQKSRGAALLSLTGDSAFLKDISQKAKQLGMLLNQYGLWKWTFSDPLAVSMEDFDESTSKGYWSLLNSSSEEDIFDELGIPFVEPERRNFNYLMSRAKPRRF
ncbi:hypothetical protein CVT24_004530 [Panaeolus cyanescens]|uniref:DNA polymerase n=1 Tax=Panaeolus cyanescens TaxID=181874 RepID=A0A409YBU6_9AGAR|nr:hypothetical protein CVT24_004530 [Panaeolus cyanescens]